MPYRFHGHTLFSLFKILPLTELVVGYQQLRDDLASIVVNAVAGLDLFKLIPYKVWWSFNIR